MARKTSEEITDSINMPEKQEIETKEAPVIKPAKWQSIGVTLDRSDLARLQAIVDAKKVTRNSLLRSAVLKFLDDYESGRLDDKLEVKPRKGTLKIT